MLRGPEMLPWGAAHLQSRLSPWASSTQSGELVPSLVPGQCCHRADSPFALQKSKDYFFFTAITLPQAVPHERKSVTRSPAVCKILSEPPFTFSWGKNVRIDCPGGGNEVTDWELGGTYL